MGLSDFQWSISTDALRSRTLPELNVVWVGATHRDNVGRDSGVEKVKLNQILK
jgi:hypothetical protein